jgi:ABC-type multidrug transport system permease subunit
MVELYFLIYQIPKMMSRLAREKNRSAFKWSLIGVAAWIVGEFVASIVCGLVYGMGTILFGWPKQIPSGMVLLFYVLALAAAIGSLTLARRILNSRSEPHSFPLPPLPPPHF